MSGHLSERTVTRALRGRLGRPYRFVEECASTQDLLRDGALPEGAVAVADHQTAGRGRSGRSWDDAPGDALLCSVLLRPPGPNVAQLSLVCGLAVAEAVEAVTGAAATLKWPNDVVLDDRKVCGILLERHGDTVICGIGVNVGQPAERLPAGGVPPAGSLLTVTGRRHDRAALLVEALERLEHHYDTWRKDGFASQRGGIEARNWLRERRVVTTEGAGVADRIASDGRLGVTLDSGERLLVASGEVTLASEAPCLSGPADRARRAPEAC